MVPHENSPSEIESSGVQTAWRILSMWRTIAAISIGLALVTFNPLLSAFFPYIRAGWPSVQTGFWLKMADPWKARGTVGLLFHLCMAGFRAAVCGFLCVIGTMFAAIIFNQNGDVVPAMIAIASVLFSCLLSFVFGWLGVVGALRHGIRVFVRSNLYDVCRGDFHVAATLPPTVNRTNPAHYIIAIAAATPLLAIWFVCMILTIPADWSKDRDQTTPYILLSLLPVVIIACTAIVWFLSARIIAASPADCWGAEIPEPVIDDSNWYRIDD